MYHVTIKIHNLTITQNQGQSRIIDIAAIKLRNATKRLRKSIATDFYGDQTDADGDGKMIGLQGAIQGEPETEKLIGGIDMKTNSWYWKNHSLLCQL